MGEYNNFVHQSPRGAAPTIWLNLMAVMLCMGSIIENLQGTPQVLKIPRLL
jgi:hypothetical protein